MNFIFYVILIVMGAFFVKAYAIIFPEPVSEPITIIKDRVKTHSIIEHEVMVTTSYEFCPDVPGKNPKLFIMYPMKLNYELGLSDMDIVLDNKIITVNASEIKVDAPTVYNDKLRSYKIKKGLSLVDRDKLINQEIAKSFLVGEYLTKYFLYKDEEIEEKVKNEVSDLVSGMASVLGVDFTDVVVNLKSQPQADLKLQAKLELCDSSIMQANSIMLNDLEIK